MGYRYYSPGQRECAIRLYQAGWDLTDILFAVGCSQASFYHWLKLFEDAGTANKPMSPLRGCPRIIGLAAFTACKELFAHSPDTYLDELQWFLAIEHDIAISTQALQDNLKKAGLTRKLLHKIAHEQDEQHCQDYWTALQTQFSGTGDEFVTVDESSKNEHTLQCHYGRSLRSTTAVIEGPFVRGQRYSLVAAMSKQGYIASRVVEGSFDSFEFFDFIVEDVVRLCMIYFIGIDILNSYPK